MPPASPFSADLQKSLTDAIQGVERKGQITWGVSLQGAELAAGWMPSKRFWIAGVFQTDWAGKRQAGIKGVVKW